MNADQPESSTIVTSLLANRRLALNTTESIHFVQAHEIMRCESTNNYTLFFLRDRRKIVVCKTLKEFEQTLEPWGFVRVHQSHLINIDYLERFDKKNNLIIMQDQSEIPVSSRKREKFLQLIRG